MMVWFSWLCLLLFIITSSNSSISPLYFPSNSLCRPYESSALLAFKNSFQVINETNSFCKNPNNNSTMSWDMRKDCCSWSGVTCDELTGHVIGLHLKCGGLRGVIDSKLWFFLTHLQTLDLSFNHFDGSEISPNFGRFVGMIHLDLSYSGFTGQVPPELAYLSKLQTLNLYSYPYSLRLKTSSFKQLVSNLTNLRELSLGGVNMSSVLPSSFMNLSTSLTSLDLSYCELKGEFPENIFCLPNLHELYLSNNPNLIGLLPKYNWTSPLRYLGLSSTGFSEFPYHLRSLENLRFLDLSHNRIEGNVPQWIWNLGNNSLILLNISQNYLTHMSQIPWKSTLEIIDLRSNQLQGHIPIPPLSTRVFLASNNHFTGEMSSLFCSLGLIEVFDLSNNNLSGNIPPCIGNFSNSLSVLDLRMNKFDGIIPSSFVKGNSLTTLNLNGNQLEGPLPQSILNCESLEVLDVGNNWLNGSFPWWLESLPDLQVLILRSNQFHGPIDNPKVRFPFQKLRIMDVSENRFAGVLPEKYMGSFVAMMDAHLDPLSYMSKKNYLTSSYYQDSVVVAMKGSYVELVKIHIMFITIDFSRNNFTGEIPELIGKLNSLIGLNLSHNKLSGPIPTSFGNLFSLEWLDLSSNELVGNIPWQLVANLYQLQFINLSNNQLEGRIPQGKQFDTFNNDSLSGNLGLCGFPLSKSCGELTPQEEDEGDDHSEGLFDWKIVMMGYAGGVIIGLSIGYIVFFSRRFDYWLAKRIGREPQRRRKTNARFRGRGRN